MAYAVLRIDVGVPSCLEIPLPECETPSSARRILSILAAPDESKSLSVDKLKSLGISLPPLTPPVAAFVPYTITGNLVFLSGTIARKDGKPWVGKLGRGIDTGEGKEAARAIAIDLMAALHHATGGNLDRVKQLVKLLVLVNSDESFTEQHLVANGASELLKKVFGDKGPHARSAVGVAQLPFGSCVEIEMIAELE